MENFIKTNDEETYEKLLKEGFQFLGKQDGMFTFVNNGKANFSSEDKKKIAFTNVLCM